MRNIVLIAITLMVSLSYNANGAVKSKNNIKYNNAEEVLQKGRDAFLNYDFEQASELYDQYKNLKNRAKKPLDEEFEVFEKQLEIAENAFESVQMIEIVDSISVPGDSFYKSFNLAQSSGRIEKPSNLKAGLDSRNNEVSFISEDGNYIVIPEPNEEGYLRLQEYYKLLDGKWEKAEGLKGDFELSGDYIFPFMSGDGQTLYFANDGEESMGGYDLFVVQKEPISGEFRQPLNLGMPFNSPYNDMLMAIDEENGLGWWATDRNSEDGMVTIYVYKLVDIRKNYPSDTEDLVNYAKINEYKKTQLKLQE